MPAQGKHRRPRNNRVTRTLAVASTGGAALALPLTAAATASAAPAAAQPTTVAQVTAAPAAAVAAAKPATYSVVAGDTLFRIAVDHAVTGGWEKLFQDNRAAIGDDPSLIRPGTKLTLGAKVAERPAPDRADRSQARTAAAPAKAKTYTDDLDGWIKESLDVLARNGIPGTYEGIHRNIMRESSGNPLAINNWDSNAAAGTPSKGLLQVIDPTFSAYHVPGTPFDPYHPVANITAACNYAADRYGSIDNVNGPY
jgi:hypothetical protein